MKSKSSPTLTHVFLEAPYKEYTAKDYKIEDIPSTRSPKALRLWRTETAVGCMLLKQRTTVDEIERTRFSNEKILTAKTLTNTLNNRVYARVLKKRDVTTGRLLSLNEELFCCY